MNHADSFFIVKELREECGERSIRRRRPLGAAEFHGDGISGIPRPFKRDESSGHHLFPILAPLPLPGPNSAYNTQ